MATLGELRQHVADSLADAADGKSSRVIQRVVNSGLADVFGSHAWSRFRALTHVPLDQAVTRAALTIAEDGDRLTCGAAEVFLQKFVDEKWCLTIAGEENLLFTLRGLDNERAARLGEGQKWIQSDASAVSGTFKRGVYPLPDGCVAVRSVELSASGFCLVALNSERFDRMKYETPTETGSPQWFTVRQGEIEVWPPLGTATTREALVVSYERTPRVFKVGDADGLAVDWDPRWDDVLRLALDVEMATRHPGTSRLDLASCRARYKERLHVCKGDDSGIAPGPTSMTLGLGGSDYEADLFRRSPTGSDA